MENSEMENRIERIIKQVESAVGGLNDVRRKACASIAEDYINAPTSLSDDDHDAFIVSQLCYACR